MKQFSVAEMLEKERIELNHMPRVFVPLRRSSSAADETRTVKFALANESVTGIARLGDGGQHLMKFERDFSLM